MGAIIELLLSTWFASPVAMVKCLASSVSDVMVGGIIWHGLAVIILEFARETAFMVLIELFAAVSSFCLYIRYMISFVLYAATCCRQYVFGTYVFCLRR